MFVKILLVIAFSSVIVSSSLDELDLPAQQQNSAEELGLGTCSTLPTTIHVIKEELDESGAVARICEGDVQVSKCEGTCSSQLKPSVSSPTGFAKVS